MSASATLRDEQSFERHLIGLVGGGCVAGVVASVLEVVVGRPVEALGALSFAAVVGLMINQLDPREDTALMRLIVALLAGLLMAAGVEVTAGGAPWWAAALGGGLMGAALSFGRPHSRGRKLWTYAVFAAALPAGVFTAKTLFYTEALQLLDAAIVREVLRGTVWGVFLGVAAGVSDLRWERDSVAGKLGEAMARYDNPVRDYLDSASGLYRQVMRECDVAGQDDMRQRALEIAADTVASSLRFAARFDELRKTLRRADSERLKRRIERMERRLEQADSASVARELEQVKGDILAQLQMRQRLELACARLESSLQRSLTTLETLHVTLVEHATNASNDAGLTESLCRLEALADEVQLKNLSVDELCEVDSLPDAAEAGIEPEEPCPSPTGRSG